MIAVNKDGWWLDVNYVSAVKARLHHLWFAKARASQSSIGQLYFQT